MEPTTKYLYDFFPSSPLTVGGFPEKQIVIKAPTNHCVLAVFRGITSAWTVANDHLRRVKCLAEEKKRGAAYVKHDLTAPQR